MKNNLINRNKLHWNNRGFVLPLTLFLCSTMIIITTSISTILVNQLYFSRISRASQVAFYAAENAIACAKNIDDSYGGIFPGGTDDPSGRDSFPDFGVSETLKIVSDARVGIGLTSIDNVTDILCAQNAVFNPGDPNYYLVTPFTYSGNGETGHTSTFEMSMPLGDGTYRCAKVTINKTLSYRQIISQGYSVCKSPARVERAIVNTSSY